MAYSDSSLDSFEVPDNFQLLLTDENLQVHGLLFTNEDLNLGRLFRDELVGILNTDENLNLNTLF